MFAHYLAFEHHLNLDSAFQLIRHLAQLSDFTEFG